MNINYTWIFNNFKVQKVQDTLTDVVITVDWHRIAQADGFSANIYGQISLTAPDPSNFTPFEQITEQQVTDWVTAALTPERVAQYDADLASNLENQQNPPVVTKPAPWSPI